MSIYGNCTVCRVEVPDLERVKGGDVCEECLPYWIHGEEKCEECNGHGSIYEEGDCEACEGKGHFIEKPGYLVAKEEREAEVE